MISTNERIAIFNLLRREILEWDDDPRAKLGYWPPRRGVRDLWAPLSDFINADGAFCENESEDLEEAAHQAEERFFDFLEKWSVGHARAFAALRAAVKEDVQKADAASERMARLTETPEYQARMAKARAEARVDRSSLWRADRPMDF